MNMFLKLNKDFMFKSQEKILNKEKTLASITITSSGLFKKKHMTSTRIKTSIHII